MLISFVSPSPISFAALQVQTPALININMIALCNWQWCSIAKMMKQEIVYTSILLSEHCQTQQDFQQIIKQCRGRGSGWHNLCSHVMVFKSTQVISHISHKYILQMLLLFGFPHGTINVWLKCNSKSPQFGLFKEGKANVGLLLLIPFQNLGSIKYRKSLKDGDHFFNK